MSKKHYTKKTLHPQTKDQQMFSNPLEIVTHLWISGDDCAPTELPLAEVQSRLMSHVEAIGNLRPSDPEYNHHVRSAHLYNLILQR